MGLLGHFELPLQWKATCPSVKAMMMIIILIMRITMVMIMNLMMIRMVNSSILSRFHSGQPHVHLSIVKVMMVMLMF